MTSDFLDGLGSPEPSASLATPSVPSAPSAWSVPATFHTPESTDPPGAPNGLPLPAQAWAPRFHAAHLAKGPNGIWYWRLTVPDLLRQRHPELPKELRRSTKTAHRCHALAKARKMCLDFFVKYSNEVIPMPALDRPPQQSFTLTYENGVVKVQHSPDASPETLGLMQLCWRQVTCQVLGYGQFAANDANLALESKSSPAAAIGPDDKSNRIKAPDNVATATTGEPSILLSDAIEDWHVNGGHRFSETSWKHDYEPTFRVFRELIASNFQKSGDTRKKSPASPLDVRMDQITREHIKSFYEDLKILPPNQGRSTKNTDARKRIEEREKNNSPLPSPHSVEKKIGHITPFIRYAKKKGWIPQEVLDEVELAQAAARSDLASENRQVGHKKGFVALTADELRRLFEGKSFLNGAMNDPWRYWIPLICLCQGTRVSEASQLYTSDFSVREGVPCVSFINDDPQDADDNDEDTQGKRKITAATADAYRRLKNQASRRVVPLHPKLIELGLLEFVEKLKASSSNPVHLFPGLPWSEDSLFGRQPSRYMRGLLKVEGIAVRRRKVPHSLRSNFHQELAKTGLHSDLQERLLGHVTGKMKDQCYGRTDDGPAFPFAMVLPYLAMVDFGINVPSWREVTEQGRIARQNGTLKRPVTAR